MGLSALAIAAWAAVTVSGTTALAANVRANKQKAAVNKTAIKAPSSAINDKIDEDSVSLGSDRASSKGKRKGRRQLMTPQTTTATPTGLQI